MIFDSVRGASDAETSRLSANTDGAESLTTDEIDSFDSDGWTMDTGLNGSGSPTYVAWNWKAGTTFDPKTDGTIAVASGSKNTTAGFSIVKYTGESGTPTVGHGLGVAPDIIIIKDLTEGYEWNVTSPDNISTTKRLVLNTDAAKTTGSGLDSPYIGSSVFTLSDGTSRTNDGASEYMAYCFTSIEGYSKVGSYTGNENADGTFIYTGFKPAFVMNKDTTSANSWQIVDNKRNPYNLADTRLIPNLNNAESTNTDCYDFVSNGFKIRTSDANFNTNNNVYIYIAFAESPFKTSNAR